nr:hypothetical protein [Tanacetum cinerariifolium]
MSSDSHATITYTSMSSYEVIVNGYYGMPMDPLDPYVQLVMDAPPSPDYIPGPEAPPSPDYIPGPEAPLSPDYIPGLEYPEYLPPADDDDADDEDEEGSSDSEEEKEEHLAPTVPASALYKVERLLAIPTPPLSPVSPTSYPLPPFLMPLPIFTPLPTSSFPLPLSLPSTFGSESIPEADIPLRKRARFTTPTGGYEVGESFVAAAARQIRPALTIADRRRGDDRLISRLWREKRYFRTLSTTYAQEVAHSRDYCTQIMDYCQSREVHTSTLVTQIEALQRDVSTLQRQHIDDEDRLMRHIQHEHAQRDVAPEDENSFVSCGLEPATKDQIEDPTFVVMEHVHLLKKKRCVVGERGQSCHNLTPFVVEERGLKCH